MKQIVSYGGGVNGVAMLISMVKSGNRPDAILFADTGAERQETYDHIEYFSNWLFSQNFPGVTKVYYYTKKHRRITLEQEIIKAKTLPSIAFGFKTCSQKHKIWPQHKWVKYRFGNESVMWYVGFDANEHRRIKENPEPGYVNRYPLIELGWTRDNCIEEIIKAGVIVPPKSSCYFCPNLKRKEILALPKPLQRRAIDIERNAELTSIKGLGRSFSWYDLIEGKSKDADEEEKNQETFKRLTGEDLNPIVCECI